MLKSSSLTENPKHAHPLRKSPLAKSSETELSLDMGYGEVKTGSIPGSRGAGDISYVADFYGWHMTVSWLSDLETCLPGETIKLEMNIQNLIKGEVNLVDLIDWTR